MFDTVSYVPSASDLAAGQDGDGVAEAFDDREIVLYHEDRPALADPLDQVHDAIHVTMRHAGGRLVQQHHLGFKGESGGNLQGALQAIGQVGNHGFRERGEPDVEQ